MATLARVLVQDMLAASLPVDVDVIGYARNIDAPTSSTVMVRVDRVRPSPAGLGLRLYEIALVLIAARTTAGPADDELDQLLEDVMHALESDKVPNGVTWSVAERASYGEPDPTNPAYELALQVTIAKEE